MALPYQICTVRGMTGSSVQLSHLFPRPCLMLLKIEAEAYAYHPSLLRDLGASLK